MASLKWDKRREFFTENPVWDLLFVTGDNRELVAGNVKENLITSDRGFILSLFTDNLRNHYECAKTLEEAQERLASLVLNKLFENGDAYVRQLRERGSMVCRFEEG